MLPNPKTDNQSTTVPPHTTQTQTLNTNTIYLSIYISIIRSFLAHLPRSPDCNILIGLSFDLAKAVFIML